MDAHSLQNLVDLYILRCEVEGKSPPTTRAYRWTLERFLIALGEDGAPDSASDVTREHIYAYLGRFTHLAADTRSPRGTLERALRPRRLGRRSTVGTSFALS